MRMQRADGAGALRGLLACAALLLLTLLPARAVAGDASLTWNRNSEADLAGYKVHYGTLSRNYQFSVNVGNVTSYTVTGLGLGTYYFAVTAYDTSGNESGYSAEVSKSFADTTPPVISSIQATGVTSSGATISWSTNEPSTSQVEYGTTTAYGTSTPLDSSLVTSHSRPLSGLQPSMLYHYRVWSVDGAGNVAVSADNIVTTLAAADTTPPVISGVTASNLTSSGAVVTWTTNEASNTQVEYGVTTSYGSLTPLNSTLVTSHSQTLGGLAASTLYHYRVRSRDVAGNLAVSGDFTFTTTSAPDTTAPVISNVAAGNPSSTGATVTWTTNEAATSQVEYGTTTAYGSSTTISTTLVTSHNRVLSGLQPNTLYHYRVRSADGANNLALSSDRTFTTTAAPDTTPPGDVRQFTAVSGDQRITLLWINPSDSDFVGARILFRTDRYPSGLNDGTLLGDFTGPPNGAMNTVHSGLQNDVTYYYSASSYDLSGNYQSTVYVSATPTVARVDDPSNSAALGCGGGGSIAPWNDGGPPSGPPQLHLLLSYLLVLAVGLLKWLRRLPALLSRCVAGLPRRQPLQWARAAVALAVWLTLPASVWAGSAMLAWSANPEGDVSGYKLYYGTSSGSYGASINVGNQLSVSVSGLAEGLIYYFALSAYDTSGNESPLSAEVSKFIDATGGAPAGGGGCGLIRLSSAGPPPRWDLSLPLLIGAALLLGGFRRRAGPAVRRGCVSTLSVPGERWISDAMGRRGCRTGERCALALVALLMVVLVGAQPLTAQAAGPVILYTDIVSGPNAGGENNNGTYLSIFGKNFGSSRGTSQVFINNVEVAAYKYWGLSNGRPDVQQITVQPGSAVSSGPIRVVVGGVASNTDRSFTVRPGAIYFVALNGNDATGAVGSIASPFRSVQATYDRADFGPGDTIVMRGGTWEDVGTGANFIRLDPKDGTPTDPMAILAYPGERVFIHELGGGASESSFRFHQGYGKYLTVSGVEMDLGGDSGGFHTSASTRTVGVRLVNNELYNMHGNGSGAALITGAFHKSHILGNHVHDGGDSKLYHGIYIADNDDGPLEDLEIAYNWVHDINVGDAGRCIQNFTDGAAREHGQFRLSIHGNLIHDCERHAISFGPGTKSGQKVYNNVIFRTGLAGGESGIRLNNEAVPSQLTAEIYNNTCYDNAGGCIKFENGGAVTVRNNLVRALAGQSYSETFGSWTGTITASHNAFFGVGAAPSWGLSNAVTLDPLLVAPALGDFHLQALSPARDVGVATGVARDYDGVSRPQGAAHDLGAFEYDVNSPPPPGDTTPPAAPTGLTVQ